MRILQKYKGMIIPRYLGSLELEETLSISFPDGITITFTISTTYLWACVDAGND